ncbi:MAG: RNA polymerase sigma factor [Terriglobales bacterium]
MATTLCGRAKEGERQALLALFQAHARRVYSLSLRATGDVTAAENLTRDIFVEAFSRLDTIEDDSAFAASFYRRAAKKMLTNRAKHRYPQGFGHRLGPHQHLSLVGWVELAIHPE